MAKKMMDVLHNFGTNNSVSSLKVARIVIYEASMYQEYSKYARKKGIVTPSWVTYIFRSIELL